MSECQLSMNIRRQGRECHADIRQGNYELAARRHIIVAFRGDFVEARPGKNKEIVGRTLLRISR